MENFLEYIDLIYVFSLISATEICNFFISKNKNQKKIVTLLVALALAVVFVYLDSEFKDREYMFKILVSFLGSVGLYDFIVKPLKDKVVKKEKDEKLP